MMNQSIPRCSVFAGPNGSGKSTIKELLPEQLLGVYINADDIESIIKRDGHLDISTFSIIATEYEILHFIKSSNFLK